MSAAACACDVRGGYAAATLLPWRRGDDGHAAVLLGVERRKKEGIVLTMLAGKMDSTDADALVTAVREFAEESGGFLGAAWQRETIAALSEKFGIYAHADGDLGAANDASNDSSVAALDTALSALSLSTARTKNLATTLPTTTAASPQGFRPGAETAVAWVPGWRGLIFFVPAGALGAAFYTDAVPDVRVRHAAAAAAAGAESTENMLSLEWVLVRDLLAACSGSAAAKAQLPAQLGRVLGVTLREGPVVEHLVALERGRGGGATRRKAPPKLAGKGLVCASFCDNALTQRTRAFASAVSVRVRACCPEEDGSVTGLVTSTPFSGAYGDFSSAVRAVCVLQGEVAFVQPSHGDSRFICSDEATTCAILFLRSTIGTAWCAHVDSSSAVERFFAAVELSGFFRAGSHLVEASFVGSYRGGNGSADVVLAIVTALTERAVPIRVACVLDENVIVDDTAARPVARPVHSGAVLDVISGELRPARVFEWGADELPRRARLWTTTSTLQVIRGWRTSTEPERCEWTLTALSIRELLGMTDAELLAKTSSSPDAEGDDFPHKMRGTLAFIAGRLQREAKGASRTDGGSLPSSPMTPLSQVR